jgi:micrococcal nuclease
MSTTGTSTNTPSEPDASASPQQGQHSLHSDKKTTHSRVRRRSSGTTKLVTSLVALVASIVGAYGVLAQGDAATSATAGQARVTRVVDGDTVKVDLDGHSETLRLIGVDTPETVDPRRPVGCYGKEASNFTKSLLPAGTALHLERDVEERDRYGRLLVYVYRTSDNLFVNAELARRGYAQTLTIPPNVAHEQEFADLAAAARSRGDGLWGACAEGPAGR